MDSVMPPQVPNSGAMIRCQCCGKMAPRRGQMQKYCADCSRQKDMERKDKWRRSHLHPFTQQMKRRNAERHKIAEELGRKISHKEKWPFCWMADCYSGSVTDPQWSHRISIPWNPALLRNHYWSTARKGHRELRQETRNIQDEITRRFRDSKSLVKHNKVWIDILAQRPDHRSGDTVNLIDRICDAIKKAIDVDDRWFCITRVDWQVVKKDPRILIGIGQPACEDSQVCAICGRILPLRCFNRNRNHRLGIGRECKDCSRPMDRLKRIQRAEGGLPSVQEGIPVLGTVG